MKSLFLILCLAMSVALCAQTLERPTISSMGQVGQKLESTLGETAIGGKDHLTQGFQQGKLIITSISTPHALADIILYPNPTSDLLFIQNKSGKSINSYLFDGQGKKLNEKKDILEVGRIDVHVYPPGNYLLLIVDESGITHSYLIQKTK